ncbi:MAG: trypsin-like peptidase domain-containing protein [Myxococcales bacterium]|nr:trypsin-like peptidase domain-containing protein [Myxococcales bacterium]
MHIASIPSHKGLADAFSATVRLDEGAGFLLARGESRFLVTAEHVVRGKEQVAVHHRRCSVNVPVLARDTECDIALLDDRLPDDLPCLAFPRDDFRLSVGDAVWALGFPDQWSALQPLLSRGHLAGVDGNLWLALDAGFGSSGGPVVTIADDQVLAIGMVRARAGKPKPWLVEGLGLARELRVEFEAKLARVPPDPPTLTQLAEAASYEDSLRQASTLEGIIEAVDEHFRTGFVEAIPIDSLLKLLP